MGPVAALAGTGTRVRMAEATTWIVGIALGPLRRMWEARAVVK